MRPQPGGRRRLHVRKFGDGADLLHQTQRIPHHMFLGHLAGGNPQDGRALNADRFSGCGHIDERPV